MFKAFYKKIIIGAFGEYIENFDDKLIEVSKWEGSFKAENLILKKDGFKFFAQSLGIPFEIKFGLIKKIELQVEWDKIISSPSYILINDIHVLCELKHHYDQQFKDRIKAKITNEFIEKKFKQLCEKIFKEKYADPNFADSITWKQKLTKSFSQNINLLVDNIHIRFEENYDNRKFNFGATVGRLEWLNTDKNGDELFLDYETRKSIGKSFSSAKLYRFGLYFNATNSNVNNFTGMSYKNENNKSLINYLNDSKQNETIIVTRNEAILTNILPPIYQQFYDFSAKILNFTSLEFNNQYFIIEPIDFVVKMRKNLNYHFNDSFPLSSMFLDINEQDFNIKVTDSILNDLIYLNFLKTYHTKEEPFLAIKRDFLTSNYKSGQLGKLLKSVIEKLKGKIKTDFYIDKQHFSQTLRNIQNYKSLYFNILLNQHEYTVIKLKNEELFTCAINGKRYTFENLKELTQTFLDIQFTLDEKLIYHLRLVTLIKFKKYLKEIDPNATKPGIIKSIFSYFSPNKPVRVEPEDITKELSLSENYEYIEHVLNNIPVLDSEALASKKQKSKFQCFKLHCVNITLQMTEQKDKYIEVMKIQVKDMLYQAYQTNFAKKDIFICDQLFIFDQSMPSMKFRYIISQKKNLTMSLTNTIKLDNVFDEVTYDNDGFIDKLSKAKFKALENSFLKLYKKSYVSRPFYANTILFDIMDTDIFLNLSFFENITAIANLCITENDTFQTRTTESSNAMDNEIIPEEKNSEVKTITKYNFYDVVFRQTRIFVPYNILTEDYKSFFMEFDGITVKTEKLDNLISFKNFGFNFSPNFMSLLNVSDSQNLKIISPFDISIIHRIKNNQDIKEITFNNEIDIYINKTILKDLFEIYQNILKIKITKLKRSSGLQIKKQADILFIANDELNNNKSLSASDEFQEALEEEEVRGEAISEIIFPIHIRNEIRIAKLNLIKFYIEDFNNPKNQICLSFNNIHLSESKDLDTAVSEKRMEILYIKLYFLYDQTVYYCDYEEDYTRSSFYTWQKGDRVNYAIDIDFSKIVFSKRYVQRLVDNYLFYKSLLRKEDLQYQSEQIFKNEAKLNKVYKLNLNVNQMEFYYSDEDNDDGLSADGKNNRFVFNGNFICEKNDKTSIVKITNFNFSEINKNFSLYFTNNEVQNMQFIKDRGSLIIAIDDFNISIKSSIINCMKDFKIFMNFILDLKSKLKPVDLSNSENIIHESVPKLFRKELMIRSFSFYLDLFSANELKLSTNGFKLIDEPFTNQSFFSFDTFKLFACHNKIENSNQTETLLIDSFNISKSYNEVTVTLENEIKLSFFYYNLYVLKDVHKFYQHLMNNITLPDPKINNNNNNGSEVTLKASVKNINIFIYDFFLKSELSDITNNNKLYFKANLNNISFEKSKDNLIFRLSFTAGSTTDTFLKLHSQEYRQDIMNYSQEQDGIMLDNEVDEDKIEIQMKGKELFINLNYIQVVISEGILSMTKLVRKYITLFKYLFKDLNAFRKSDSSTSKLNQVILYLLELKFFKLQMNNFLFKFKRQTFNNSGDLALTQNFNIGFCFDFFFSNENLDLNKDRLPDFSAQFATIEAYFETKVKKRKIQVVNDKNYIISPFQVVIISKDEEVTIKVNSIEIDCSVKKLSMIKHYLSIIDELSSVKARKTHITTKSNFAFKYKCINADIDSFTIIVAKEDSLNIKLYELLFCFNLDNINLSFSDDSLRLNSKVKCEYFNSFNESWEPIIEKNNINILKKQNKLDFIFDFGVNLVFSIQFLKTAKLLHEDFNYMDNYISLMKSNELIQNEEDFLLTSEKEGATNATTSKSNLLSKQTMSYKLLNNHLNFNENAYIRNTYHFQIENLTGEELLLLVDDSSVVKINHQQTIQIEKVLFQLENLKNFNSITNGRTSTNNASMTSLLSATNSDFKSNLQFKFKQHKEKINQLKFIKYIYFKIPQLKESFCINLLKNTQEIEIKTNSIYKQIKLLVNIFIDTNGRKVVSLKSPIAMKNNLFNYSLEMQLIGKVDTKDQQNMFNTILKPNTLNYIPIRYINFSHFRIRPYVENMNYNQPYSYSAYTPCDHDHLSDGKIISTNMKEKKSNAAEALSSESLFKILCISDIVKNGILREYHFTFDYTLEIRNYLPVNLFLIISNSNTFRHGSNEVHFDRTFIKDNLISIEPFTHGRFNTFNPDEVHSLSVLNLLNDLNSPIDIVKQISLKKFITEHVEYFQYRLSETSNRLTTVKVAYTLTGGKLLFNFFVDYIVINDLNDQIDLIIDSDENKRTTLHMSSQAVQRRIINSANDPVNLTRKISIESDLLSHKSISKTFNNDEPRKFNVNDVEKSIGLHNFGNHGLVSLINGALNIKESVTFLELNQKVKAKINNKLNNLTYTEKLIKENLKLSDFNSKNIYSSLRENNQNLIQYFSIFDNDKIIIKQDNSEEAETNFIKDVYNVYKNHFVKLTYPNKNMIELLCNVKYLDEYFNSDTKELSRTKIIFVENRYQFVNNSNLNLIITQEKCFKDGFYVLHPYEKLNFKWIDYSCPLLIKMKINDSNFTKPINIDTIGELYLNLRLINKFTNLILKVSIVENQGKTIVYIDDSTTDPPISIENKTNKLLKIVEKETPSNNIILYPYTTVSFCLNNVTANKVEIFENTEGLEQIYTNEKYNSIISINLSELAERNKMNRKTVVSEKGLNFELTKNESMNYVFKIKEKENEKAQELAMVSSAKTGKVKYRIISSFIGISVIDLTPKEIMYFYIKSVKINKSIYNKKLYKLKFDCDSIQIDNSIEHQYYEIILRTFNSQYINNPVKPIKLVIEFSYNQMGNIMFINKLLFDIKSEIALNLDGIFMFELWNFLKNLNKLKNEQNSLDDEQALLNKENNRIKVLTNKVLISKIYLTLSFKPSSKLLKNLTQSQK
jgi:hypothetical protein